MHIRATHEPRRLVPRTPYSVGRYGFRAAAFAPFDLPPRQTPTRFGLAVQLAVLNP